MKKLLSLVALMILVFAMAGCQKETKTLSVYFVPSRDAAEILEATEPLKELLKAELAELGFEFDEIIIEVGSSYEAVGEAMISGTADVGFLPGGTYSLYSVDDEVDVILTALRSGLDKDFPDAIDWNDGLATERVSTVMVAYYRGLIVAGPSPYGRMLSDKVNAGTALTWDDFDGANWCVRSSTSSSGFIYPTIWLMQQFNDQGIIDLANYVQTDGYGSSVAALAAETCDLATMYADARMDYADKWTAATDAETPGFGRALTIWEETDVVGVTPGIYNDTISVSNLTVSDELKVALQTAFINIAGTEEGLEIIAIYSHAGYQVAVSADYDNERAAQAILAGD
ncbi:MAG: PhnD/SsuA/transferrin family substrate-binding protein [Candidatus Izimaplasma sp.]|nr:PhnD/SsuA/transferrin family substrate-binding protein [Candidatus Izimaplasma bacterium]